MYKDTFVTQDKDYIIELSRKELSLFQDTNNMSTYYCTLTFKNNLGTIIKTLTLSDTTISLLLDNIYSFLEMNSEMFFLISSTSTNCIDTAIRITIDPKYDESGNIEYYQYFKIFSYCNESMILQFQFDVSNSLYEFAEKLYDLIYKTYV